MEGLMGSCLYALNGQGGTHPLNDNHLTALKDNGGMVDLRRTECCPLGL